MAQLKGIIITRVLSTIVLFEALFSNGILLAQTEKEPRQPPGTNVLGDERNVVKNFLVANLARDWKVCSRGVQSLATSATEKLELTPFVASNLFNLTSLILNTRLLRRGCFH